MPWHTHDIGNQVDELQDYNLYTSDLPLQEAMQRGYAHDHEAQLTQQGAELGLTASFELAAQANRYPPELTAFDRRGRRIDRVLFHPSWHELMQRYRAAGLATLPFAETGPGRWSAYAASFYLHGQIESGALCPATMTLASIPVLQQEPALFATLRSALYSRTYDSRDLPLAHKSSLWLGMGMTEKQGGSDVRSNTTHATPLGSGGRGGEYTLTGHKWFFSAPMCDAHIVLARSAAGHSCFLVPRWRPDGSKNAVLLQGLKNKLGNRSNASAEVEFQDAWGLLLGEPGRGIPTILEMATYTRLNCVIGSTALMRQAVVQALHYARHRQAFGKTLVGHALMRSVLADLALESEAASLLMMRLAQAFENAEEPLQRAWKRIVTPAAKFWVCKRAVELTGEAMEVLGGNGYIDDGPLARLYREAPVNSIWEGSGNVMCLDVLRALGREPEAAQALFDELAAAGNADAAIRNEAKALASACAAVPETLEAGARLIAQRLVVLAQASLMRQYAPAASADAFVATRLGPGAAAAGRVYGAIDTRALDVAAILARAYPA
jgi:putative acyl-CoA dehydrogenase